MAALGLALLTGAWNARGPGREAPAAGRVLRDHPEHGLVAALELDADAYRRHWESCADYLESKPQGFDPGDAAVGKRNLRLVVDLELTLSQAVS